jgi:hypothetical protein
MNIEYILPLVTFWNAISSQFSKYLPPEIANNAVCFIHSVSFIVHYNYDFNLNYTVHASIAFFIYDLFYILRHIFLFYREHRDHREDPHPHANPVPRKYKDELNKKLPFIAHHIAAIYILYYAITVDNGYKIIDAFILLEKSNIMIYVSYHLHKQYHEYTRINALSEFVQLMTYTYYRLFALSVFIYDRRLTLFSFPYITQFLILLVCSMGYAWSYRLLKKNIANYGVIRAAAPTASAASRKYSSAG